MASTFHQPPTWDCKETPPIPRGTSGVSTQTTLTLPGPPGPGRPHTKPVPCQIWRAQNLHGKFAKPGKFLATP